jgi:hypothetical protein
MAQIKNKKFDIIVGIPTYNEADSRLRNKKSPSLGNFYSLAKGAIFY